MSTGRSAVLEGVRQVSIREFPIPEIGPDDGLLRVELSGVCASDVKSYRGELYPEKIPFIMGHEIYGRIDRIGRNAARICGVKEGDRVVVEARLRCGECYYCLSGTYHLCEKATYHAYGTIPVERPPHLWGAHGEYLYLSPGTMIHPVPDEVSAEAAVLICAVFGNAIKWVQTGTQERVGRSIVVVGPGAQGLAAVAVAKESGFSPIIAVGLPKDAKRLALARAFGASHTSQAQGSALFDEIAALTNRRGADVVVDLTGSTEGLETCLGLARKLGVIVFPNVVGKKRATITPDQIVEKELTIHGVFSRGFRHVQQAIELARSRKYPIEEIVTHAFPLDAADEAYRVAGGEVEGADAIKVVIRP